MSLGLLMDHHVDGLITAGLLTRGVDVLTLLEGESSERMDDDLLIRASSLDRVLFTRDDDRLESVSRLRASGTSFAGLCFVVHARSQLARLWTTSRW